jgi:hypothetical protein
MTLRREKLFQLLTMGSTLLLGTFGSDFLSENSVYPVTVILGPFATGYLFVLLTRQTSRGDATSLALSVVGTIGFGVAGMILSNTLDDAKPHAWIVWCHDVLWGPIGDSIYILLAFLFFVVVPVHSFMLGRILGDWRNSKPAV